MKNIVRDALLYDFYGELLTDHQKSCFEDYILNDLSLGEIASENGVSRQAISDLINRSRKILEDYESKLGLIERFDKTRVDITKICDLAESGNKDDLSQIRNIAEEILNNF